MPCHHIPWRVAMLGCRHQDDIWSGWCYLPPHIQPVPLQPPCQRETRSAPKAATICTLRPCGLGGQWWCPQGFPTTFLTLGHQTHQRFLWHEQNDETLGLGSLWYLPLLWMHGKSTTCSHLPTPWSRRGVARGHRWAGCMVWSIPHQSTDTGLHLLDTVPMLHWCLLCSFCLTNHHGCCLGPGCHWLDELHWGQNLPRMAHGSVTFLCLHWLILHILPVGQRTGPEPACYGAQNVDCLQWCSTCYQWEGMQNQRWTCYGCWYRWAFGIWGSDAPWLPPDWHWSTSHWPEVSWWTMGLATQHLTGLQDWPERVCFRDYTDAELSDGLATHPGQLHPTLTPTHFDNTLWRNVQTMLHCIQNNKSENETKKDISNQNNETDSWSSVVKWMQSMVPTVAHMGCIFASPGALLTNIQTLVHYSMQQSSVICNELYPFSPQGYLPWQGWRVYRDI